MKFRYYITDLFEGIIVGTDDYSAAAELAECEDYFIVDAETGNMLTSSGKLHSIEELK
jgi:hypothetical protein